eukprot:COSAG01_NODE_572_length_15298_cov_8.549172_6_plen_137_part_00
MENYRVHPFMQNKNGYEMILETVQFRTVSRMQHSGFVGLARSGNKCGMPNWKKGGPRVYLSMANHRLIPPWTAQTAPRDIARGRTYSRLGRGPGGVTDHHAARPTRRPHHCREVPRKDDTTATFSLRLERAILKAA